MRSAEEAIVVVGAGWSGIAAAVGLAERGLPVHLIEAAPLAGGRARRTTLGGQALDNGQHLLLGAYSATLNLLARVGIAEAQVFERRPFGLSLAGNGQAFCLHSGPGPDPLGLLTGLARCQGLSRRQRLQALVATSRLWRSPPAGTDAETWLARVGQPAALRVFLWRPLCLAALNVPTDRACAAVFTRVLREAFIRPHGCDLLLPRCDLSALLPEPAVSWLRQREVPVSLGCRVRSLKPRGRGWRIATSAGELDCGDVVLACDPVATARLLPGDRASRALAERLRRLGSEPITTAYLRYPRPVSLTEPMMGRLDGPAQWLFDRRLTGQPGTIAAVVSGGEANERWSRAEVGPAVQYQIGAMRPDWPAPEAINVVREKRATFRCAPGSERLRSSVIGPRAGLWLAGDHIDTGLPATLESAVRAGDTCAHKLAKQRKASS